MTEKLDTFDKDILSFLEEREPERVLWREIAEGLFPSYKFGYKNERGFGVALSQKLKLLRKKGLIIKEGDLYGTLKSKSPIEKKPSEFIIEVEKAKEDWIYGLKKEAEKRVVFIINSLKPEQKTQALIKLIIERNQLLQNPYSLYLGRLPYGVHKLNMQAALDMTPNFINELERILKH